MSARAWPPWAKVRWQTIHDERLREGDDARTARKTADARIEAELGDVEDELDRLKRRATTDDA